MNKLGENLKKEQIAGCKRYMRWYRVVDGKLRLFVDESRKNDKGEPLNYIFREENTALLGTRLSTYEKYKDLEAQVFIKPDSKSLYTEYEVKSWGIYDDKYLEIIFA